MGLQHMFSGLQHIRRCTCLRQSQTHTRLQGWYGACGRRSLVTAQSTQWFRSPGVLQGGARRLSDPEPWCSLSGRTGEGGAAFGGDISCFWRQHGTSLNTREIMMHILFPFFLSFSFSFCLSSFLFEYLYCIFLTLNKPKSKAQTKRLSIKCKSVLCSNHAGNLCLP